MENFLSKIFNSKNKKRVYNVDKSKKQTLKNANKNVNQLSSTYITNKLRKEFGIYKTKSEFSTTNYNMPCVIQNREYSIDSVDIIPHSFQEKQNIDLVKCTEDQRQRTLLFVNDGHSDIEPESINKEFEIDENEGCDHQAAKNANLSVEVDNLQTVKKLDGDKFNETKDQEETSNSSLTTMDLRKDSMYGRYEDACVKLNSYKCNKEFIFETKRELAVQPNNVTQTSVRSKHGNTQEPNVSSVLNGTPGCSFSRANGGDAKIGNTIDMGTSAGIHDSNKFLITKKGKVKCKSPEKEKKKNHNSSNKDDEGLSRHRYYHSMIIMGGKRKTKSNHSKMIKITNTQILEVTQKKFGNDIPKPKNKMALDFLPCDDKRLNLLQNHSSTVRTMSYYNTNNKLCSVNIPPSEHTLKWLDENFGPGSTNTTVNNSDEIDFSEQLVNLSTQLNPNCTPKNSKEAIEPEKVEAEINSTINQEKVNSSSKEHNDMCPVILNAKIGTLENTNSIEFNESTKIQSKTVRVVSFKKSRTLKSNSNSVENNLVSSHSNNDAIDENGVMRNQHINIEESENPTLTELESMKNESTKAPEKNELKMEAAIDCKITANNVLEDTSDQDTLHKKEEFESFTEKGLSSTKEDPLLKTLSSSTENCNAHVTQTETRKSNKHMEKTKENSVITEPTNKNFTDNLKLQSENIFSILRDQEKRSLTQKIDKTVKLHENIDDDKNSMQKTDGGPRNRQDKIVLKLNDEILHVADHVESEVKERQENTGFSKKYSEEENKRRHEELEKDYIMTRLELALNTEVIEKPDMAQYILEKSQEVINDVVEKTNENITKKILAQNKKVVNEAAVTTSPFRENYMKIKKNVSADMENVKNHITNEVMTESKSKEMMIVREGEKQNHSTHVYTERDNQIQKTISKDLNNISKIKNVKIYRNDNQKATAGGKNGASISINSIDNIMKNKTLLLEEIKSLKRKNDS